MRPEVQVLAGPPAIPAGHSAAGSEPGTPAASLGHAGPHTQPRRHAHRPLRTRPAGRQAHDHHPPWQPTQPEDGSHAAAAGLRAAWRYDVAAAVNLLARAHALLPSTNPQRRTVMRRLAEVYQVVGRLSDADAVLAAMLAEAEAEADESLAQVARLERARLRLFAGPDPIRLRSIREEAERALDLFGESGDEAGLALASYVLGYVHFRAGAIREMERVARRALGHADRSARRREAMAARMLVAWAVAAGATPVPEAICVCEQLVDVAGREHPMVLSELAVLRAMRGEIDDARVLIDRARALALERMRGRSPMLIVARARASVELAAGDFSAAEHELHVALDLARAAGLREPVAQTAARLSLLAVQRDPAEAALLASLSRDNAPAESVAAQALWRAATARVTASRNAYEQAQRLAREAIGLVPAEMPNLRADLLVDLAEIPLARGDRTRATAMIADAIELYERKGNLASAAQARSLAGRADESNRETYHRGRPTRTTPMPSRRRGRQRWPKPRPLPTVGPGASTV
jgi:tetratricopeptide (TPR) repeat protein